LVTELGLGWEEMAKVEWVDGVGVGWGSDGEVGVVGEGGLEEGRVGRTLGRRPCSGIVFHGGIGMQRGADST